MKQKVFVIMPFTHASSKSGAYQDLSKDDFDTIFDLLVETLKKYDYDVKRSDSASNILREIVIDIDSSELVIADLTGLNPNVMYELGIRHALCKKTILITQDLSEIPFDLKGYFCIQYNWITTSQKTKFKKDIHNTINKLETSPEARYGPFHTYVGLKNTINSDSENQLAIKRLISLEKELEFVLADSETKLHEAYKLGYSGLTLTDNDFPVRVDYDKISRADITKINKKYSTTLFLPCCDKLITDIYIPLRFNKFGEIDKLINHLRYIKSYEMASQLYQFQDDNNKPIIKIDLVRSSTWKAILAVQQFIYAIENNIIDKDISELDVDF